MRQRLQVLLTSPLDDQTDAIIQSSLRNQLSRDVTVITVAHRLKVSHLSRDTLR